MKNDDPISASTVKFIKKFLDKDYLLWESNYIERDAKKNDDLLKSFAKEFFAFPVTLLISRPKLPSESWYSEAKEYLGATIKRPLFKIERYDTDDGSVFAAYTGSNDLGSSAYYEILLFRRIGSSYKIFSIYHSDSDGGLSHHEGDKFNFTKSRLVAINKYKAPEDSMDLENYEVDID